VKVAEIGTPAREARRARLRRIGRRLLLVVVVCLALYLAAFVTALYYSGA
jgi:hypothetical protein